MKACWFYRVQECPFSKLGEDPKHWCKDLFTKACPLFPTKEGLYQFLPT